MKDILVSLGRRNQNISLRMLLGDILPLRNRSPVPRIAGDEMAGRMEVEDTGFHWQIVVQDREGRLVPGGPDTYSQAGRIARDDLQRRENLGREHSCKGRVQGRG